MLKYRTKSVCQNTLHYILYKRQISPVCKLQKRNLLELCSFNTDGDMPIYQNKIFRFIIIFVDTELKIT